MIKRLSLIKDYYEDEEEEKEEKPGWLQRTRGIGELPKYEIPESTKLKFTADVGLGVSAKATGGISLPETTEIKPLIEGLPISKPEDKPTGWTTLFQDPKAIEFEKVNFEMKREWFKGLKEAKNKIAFLKGEDRSPELEELGKKYIELAPYMYGKGEQWLPNVAMIAYGLGVVWQLTDAVVASEIWKKLNVKVENKKISFEEGLDAVFKTGWGKGTPYQRQIFDEAVKQADIQNISVVGMLKKGLTITEMKPRFAFGAGKLSAMPIPDLVKAIVEYGSIPPEIAKEIAFLDPVKVSQVTQQLLNTSPALASAFLKAVEKPEVIPQVKEEVKHVELKPGEKTTREYLDRVMGLEKPEPAKVTPFIEPKVELKAEVKVPKEVKLPEKQIIPATIEEAKEILKVDVKKPSIPKDMLAKQMIEKKVSLTDIEAVKGIKIDVTKPKDIIIALRDIKAVKKEVTVEPTPKVEVKEPIIPKEVSQEKPAVEKFPGAEWKVTDDKSLAKLGNAIAKEVGITIEDITWRFKIDENIEKGYVRGSTTAPYRNDKGELVINIAISPKDKDIMPINLQSEILHELGHIAAPNHGILGMHDEDYWKWYSENSPKLYTQTTPPTEKPAVVEEPAPIKPPISPSPPTKAEMAGEPIGDPIAKLNELIKQAKPLRGRLETKYTEERAKRIREVERVIDEVGGEQGYKMALGKLKGQLVPGGKARFEPVKDKLSKEEIDSLYNRTFKHPYLDEWEKISAANELTNLLAGELPTPKGLVLLEEIYGTDLLKSILSKRALGLKIADVLIDVANIPRAILATADMSGFLRQGIVYVVSHPVIATKAMGKTFQFAFNSKSFEQYFKDLPKDKLYPLMRKSGLAVTDPSRVLATGREEAFISRLMQQIPVIGQIIKFAERAYVGFLNKLRVDVFKTFADEFLSKGYSPVKDRELFKATAEVVNTFTGRGSMGNLNRITPFLNTIFFSPRLITARFNALNPTWYIRQPKEIRVKAISDFAKFVAAGLTLLAIIKASGLGDVETDPRSSDFGKIKIGNTRWDIWGGFQQWVRVFSQFVTGKRKNTATGEIISLTKDEYPFTTRKEIVLRFIEGKLAPVPALVNELISGAKTFEGEDITFETVAREKFIPMYIQDITEAYMDGGLGRATGAGITAFFGVGVQTWQERKSKEPFKITLPESGKLTFTKPKLDIKSTKLKFTF